MASDILRTKKSEYLATNSPEVDFALVISRVIDTVKENPAELRNTVYEVARIKLQREAWKRNPPMDIWEVRRLTIALETAIERVEAISSKQDELRALKSLDRLIETLGESQPGFATKLSLTNLSDSVRVIDHAPVANGDRNRVLALSELARRVPLVCSQLRSKFNAAPLVRACFVAIFGLALYGMLNGQFVLFKSRTEPANKVTSSTLHTATTAKSDLVAESPVEVVRAPSPAVQAQARGFPLPSVYGIYAVSNGELHELGALPGRVPDQRIFMSAVINEPSRTILPDGRIAFVAFRRDLAKNAPDRVSVRVIAKIIRAMIFNPGRKAMTTALDNSWAVRNVSYDFRVAPLIDNSEMLVIRPENPDFVLPPGRYGMALNGLAYDFTVAGQVTETAQCLERTEAANGTFYSECRKP
jgi:hypothetical protein